MDSSVLKFFWLALPLRVDATTASQDNESVSISGKMIYYFMLSGRISRNISENIFLSYTSSISENTDFHVFVA